MNQTDYFSLFLQDNALILTALFMFLFGLLAMYFWLNPALQEALRKVERLEIEKQGEEKLNEERLQMLDDSRDQFYNAFSALSHKALQDNNAQFLQLANETLSRFHSTAQSDLDMRKQAVSNLIEPIKKALDETREQVKVIEKERQESFGALGNQLKTMAKDQTQLQLETRKLVTALRRPEVRGQWGEISLKRIAELAGMVEYCDFVEQTHRTDRLDEHKRSIRPDMVVNMPDSRQLIIDAKTPMDAYLDAVDTEDDEIRKGQLLRHAKIVREHMRGLASKKYWEQFDDAPDFVVLFIPGDQFLSAALEHDKQLLNDSLSERVILATPSSLVALLRAIAFGWKQVALVENADKIRELGEELYRRVATYTEHMNRLGKSLSSSVDHYNKAIGSLERNVLPGARRFSELGLQEKKAIPETSDVERVPRLSTVEIKEVQTENSQGNS
jgi:DNA recombination protein RmuC